MLRDFAEYISDTYMLEMPESFEAAEKIVAAENLDDYSWEYDQPTFEAAATAYFSAI